MNPEKLLTIIFLLIVGLESRPPPTPIVKPIPKPIVEDDNLFEAVLQAPVVRHNPWPVRPFFVRMENSFHCRHKIDWCWNGSVFWSNGEPNAKEHFWFEDGYCGNLGITTPHMLTMRPISDEMRAEKQFIWGIDLRHNCTRSREWLVLRYIWTKVLATTDGHFLGSADEISDMGSDQYELEKNERYIIAV